MGQIMLKTQYTQRQHARYQWFRARWEKELEVAQAVFEEVSRLLDRRLFRSSQLLWALEKSSESVDAKLADYRQVVAEWNESINRILALLAIAFGDEQRNQLDSHLGAQFVAVGKRLEQAVRDRSHFVPDSIASQLHTLSGGVYAFNLTLLKMIREQRRRLHERA